MTVLLIGLDNNERADPRDALQPFTNGSSGHRLCRLIGFHLGREYSGHEFVADFLRTNLYPVSRAAEGDGRNQMDRDMFANTLLFIDWLGVDEVVLLGERVRYAFNSLFDDDLGWLESRFDGRTGTRFWAVPHPSGRNRWYNDERNYAAAAKLLAKLTGRDIAVAATK